MNKYIIGGVGVAQIFKQGFKDYIGNSKTLTESGMNFAVTEEEVRGGLANSFLGSYFHDTGLTLNMTDALFSLEYLALNVGGVISAGADIITTEQVVVGANGAVTVNETPVELFLGTGTIGWIKTPAESEDDWTKITFDGTTASTEYAEGTTVCVRYAKHSASARTFKVNSSFIPSQVSIILTLPLFRAGTGEATSLSNSSKVGEIQVKIPNFIFSGSQDLALSANGVATTSLSGKAMVTFEGTDSCDGDGYYGSITEVVFNKDEFADVKAIAVADGYATMKVNAKKTLEVWALYNGMTASSLIENTKLTFVSNDSAIAAVSANGSVTAKAAGTAEIKVMVTDHPELDSSAVIVVTA